MGMQYTMCTDSTGVFTSLVAKCKGLSEVAAESLIQSRA